MRFNRKAVSYNVSVVLMVALAISVSGAAVAIMNKHWHAQSQIFQLDLSESRMLVNEKATPKRGKMVLVIKNTGTTTAKIYKITIQTDGGEVVAYFNAPNVFLDDNTLGVFAPSSSKVMLEGGELIIASGQSASLTFPNDGTWDVSSYFTAGRQYITLVHPSVGGHIVSHLLIAESFGG